MRSWKLPASIFLSLSSVCIILINVVSTARLYSSTFPWEPERDNREYLLDLVTNDYNRVWREIWDGGDNRLRFRLGSNNVREWFIEEQLKFSAPMLKRLRIRFFHSRLLKFTNHRYSFDTIEFEGRLWGRYYASFFATPTVRKVDNSLGIMLQRRTGVDRYAVIYLEFPRFLNNFTERHKGTSDSTLYVYSRQPVKVGLEFRDDITRHLTARLSGYVSNDYEFAAEDAFTGSRVPEGGGRVRAVSGWLEYVDDTTKAVEEQNSFGVEWGYSLVEKSREVLDSYSPVGSRILIEEDAGGPIVSSPGLSLPYIEFDTDPFTLMEEDTVVSWSETRKYAATYLWLSPGHGFKVRVDLRFERWSLEWVNADQVRSDISSSYFVPSLRVRLGLGTRRASVVEGGYIAEYRKRRERRYIGKINEVTVDSHRCDHRLSIAYEYRFRPDVIVRIIESIDLDRRDWGQFSIHDHGFFQIIIGF